MLKGKAERTPRFDREAWLSAAMEVLAREGQAKLRVDKLAHELGVTKGSFYHHFKNRDDFVAKLLEYWSRAFTDSVITESESLQGTPKERLLYVMRMIERNGLNRYDIAFRSWAAQEPSVAEGVRQVDLRRFGYVRSLFAEMGFEGPDLEDRARIWLTFQVARNTVYFPDTAEDLDEGIKRQHAFFTMQSAAQR